MPDREVPPALEEVVGPLREADEYARLQEVRQRGFYNVVAGLPGFALLFPLGLLPLFAGLDGLSAGQLVLNLLCWTLFIVACNPRWFLPTVRRLRPDWTSPLLEASLLKDALEKQFWLQLPLAMVGLVLLPFVAGIVMVTYFFADGGLPVGIGTLLLAQLAMLVVSSACLAWQAARSQDRLLAMAFLSWIPVGLIAHLLDPRSQFPSLLAAAILGLALATPPLLVGFFRLLAPRRWLLR